MSYLYWINVLGSLHDFLVIIAAFIGVLVSIAFLFYCVTDDKELIESTGSFTKKGTITFIFILFITMFVPSKKEIYIIYGVGGTIDYIKNNDNAQQIPDKCIEVINKYLDEFNKED
jgi:hypothetical protein